MAKPKEEKSELRSRDRWLLFAIVLGPLAVLVDVTVSYTLVPTSCAVGSKAMLHLVTAVFLFATLCGAAIGWRYYNEFADTAGVLWKERTRWGSTLAMGLSVASAVVIIAMEIPNLILRSCD